jgi:hypothetical protein
MDSLTDMAVYAEHSDSQKEVKPDWNIRVFNRTEVQRGTSIRLDSKTGAITLGPGIYHITGSSQVTYNDPNFKPSGEGWNTEPRPNAGYCRLRYAADVDCDNELAITVGTISSANLLPSLIDTYLEVADQATVVLEHQVGKNVALIYLQDNVNNSSWHVFARIDIRRVEISPLAHQSSSLASVFCAAFRSYLSDPDAYRQLYCTYLGVLPRLTPVCGEGTWMAPGATALARVLKSGVLRFGYVEADPYVYHGSNSQLMGLDWELGNALTAIIRDQYFYYAHGKGLRAEWIGVKAAAEGDPEAAKFNALYKGLKLGLFDIAMSGQANISGDASSPATTREVDWTAPTALLFTNILYTGRGGYDLSGLVGASRERFIAVVKEWPEVKIMCVANPGPSPTNSAALVEAINKAGGHAMLDDTGTLASIKKAIAEQTIHFSVGDAVASAWIGNQPGFKGLNLDIAAALEPAMTAQPVAAFALHDV